jgi:cytidylate kinase
MVIVLFGENCAGKSSIAEELKTRLNADVYSGRDYLRYAKNEADAKAAFRAHLRGLADDETRHAVYVAAEAEQLVLPPENAVRVLVTAELAVIKRRFAARTGGRLPAPVAAMLERKHGMFDGAPHELHLRDGMQSPAEAGETICALLRKSV